MKKPKITTESLHGIDFTSVEFRDKEYMIPREITLAYSEMIDELLAQRRTLYLQLSGLDWLEKKGVDIGSYIQNNREVIEARLRCNKKALKKAGVDMEESK